MRRNFFFGTWHCLYLLAFYINSAYADTLHVPEDFSTISEAIAASVAGDVISITGEEHIEWLDLRDAEVTLQARAGVTPRLLYHWDPFSNGKASINIENASITIDGFTIHPSYQASVIAANSNLAIRNSVLYGRSYNFSRYNVSGSAQPALLWQNALNKTLTIANSQILGGNGNEPIKSAALAILNCTQSSIMIEQSALRGGDRARTWQRIQPTSNTAMYVVNSTEISIRANHCEFMGGKGFDAAVTRPDLPAVPSTPEQPYYGSSAVVIDNSGVEIHAMIGRVGAGGDGGEFTVSSVYFEEDIYENFDGANGADGLQALNSSRVVLFDSKLYGGAGGVPNGLPGAPFVMDDTSLVVSLYPSSFHYWQNYK
ncbi:hypothetical protein K8I31_16910 [bacterium]|nr:hypothetical protein [bacterium]